MYGFPGFCSESTVLTLFLNFKKMVVADERKLQVNKLRPVINTGTN